MKILIIAEHDNQTLKPATLHTLTAAKQLGQMKLICSSSVSAM